MNDSSTSTIRRLGEQKDVESLLQLWNSVEVQQSDSLRFRVIQNLPPSLDDHRIASVFTDVIVSDPDEATRLLVARLLRRNRGSSNEFALRAALRADQPYHVLREVLRAYSDQFDPEVEESIVNHLAHDLAGVRAAAAVALRHSRRRQWRILLPRSKIRNAPYDWPQPIPSE